MGWAGRRSDKNREWKIERCLGHLLDLRCCDLFWLQLSPEGGFPVNLWSLSRRCLSDLYLSATHGKWRRLSWQWFGLHCYFWLAPLSNNAVTLLTTSTLSPKPDMLFTPPSLSRFYAFKHSEYRGWFFFICRKWVTHCSAHLGNLAALQFMTERKIF